MNDCFFQGTAEVIFSSQANALAAIVRYNDMNLDGKPMKIELVGESVVANNACIRFVIRWCLLYLSSYLLFVWMVIGFKSTTYLCVSVM